jgi:hypothetical protein
MARSVGAVWIRGTVGLAAAALLALGIASGCSKGGGKGDTGGDESFATPEKTFEQVKKALVNRDPDLLWDALSKNMIRLFEDGRKELLAKPLEDRKEIAVEGMTTVEELEKLDTKGFFKFYFEYKKREVYRINSAELLDRKVDAIRTAEVKKVIYDPADPAAATKSWVHYTMAGDEYALPLVKEGNAWRMDGMDEPDPVADRVEPTDDEEQPTTEPAPEPEPEPETGGAAPPAGTTGEAQPGGPAGELQPQPTPAPEP